MKSEKSVMDAHIAVSCPVSLDNELSPEEVRDAKPYAVCSTTKQKICSSLEGAPTCLLTERTKCVEVCVRAKFCQKTNGKVVSRNHGWRSPGGKACCFEECKVPEQWFAADGSPLETTSWCHQTMLRVIGAGEQQSEENYEDFTRLLSAKSQE